jgi:hypothetical protein
MPAKAATPKKSSTAVEPTQKATLVAVAKQEPAPKPASKAKVEVNQENDADDEEEDTCREHNTKKLEYYTIKFKEYQTKLTAISDKIEYYKSLLK